METMTPAPADRLRWWLHQSRWMSDPARFRIALKARQTGFSTCVAAESIASAVAGETVLLASAGERQAVELLRKCKVFLPLVSVAAGGAIQVTKESAEVVEFSSNGRLISVPASASTVQGFSGSIVLDEFAWVPDAESLWAALVPSVSTNPRFRVSVLSTPRGKSGMFYRLWNEADSKVWSRHKVDIFDAIAGGAPLNAGELRAAIADEQIWRGAYCCEFLDEQFSLLPFDLLEARADDSLQYHAELSRLPEYGTLYAGYDVGRKRDLGVLALVETTPTGFVSRGFVDMDRRPFADQFALLESVLAHGNVSRLAIDASGIGLQLAEQAVAKHGSRVEAVTYTQQVKDDLCSRMLKVFQNGEIRIPNDATLLADLHSVEKSFTATGAVRFSAGRESGSHADRFQALALALSAASQPNTLEVRVVDCDSRFPSQRASRLPGDGSIDAWRQSAYYADPDWVPL